MSAFVECPPSSLRLSAEVEYPPSSLRLSAEVEYPPSSLRLSAVLAALVGNDIVDLSDAETRPGAQHPRFDARVFTPDELASLDRAPDPPLLRWTLWAAKESAFKLARKLDARSLFSPPSFAVSAAADGCMTVLHGELHIQVRVERSGECLHAIATLGAARDVSARAPEPPPRMPPVIEQDPSTAVRRLALSKLAARLDLDARRLRIAKTDDGIPRLHLDGAPALADLSLSHHGRFIGFACALPTNSPGKQAFDLIWSTAELAR